MNAKKYYTEVAKRGGVNAVAAQLECGRDRVLRMTQGKQPVSRRAELEISALPVLVNWQVLHRLKTDRRYRRTFAKRLAGADDATREAGERLLKATLGEFRGTVGGRQKALNRAKNG